MAIMVFASGKEGLSSKCLFCEEDLETPSEGRDEGGYIAGADV